MGRPSVLQIAADVEKGGVVARVYVAGSAVMMGYGALRQVS